MKKAKKMKIKINSTTLTLATIVALLATTGYLLTQVYLPRVAAGSSTYGGFSSYEEMMQAHHGGSCSSVGGVSSDMGMSMGGVGTCGETSVGTGGAAVTGNITNGAITPDSETLGAGTC